MSTERSEQDKSGRDTAPISADHDKATAPISADPIPRISPEKPRWLDTIEDRVGPSARPDRIYEDQDGNLHVVFYDPGLLHPEI